MNIGYRGIGIRYIIKYHTINYIYRSVEVDVLTSMGSTAEELYYFSPLLYPDSTLPEGKYRHNPKVVFTRLIANADLQQCSMDLYYGGIQR